jgi:hypothetical protein
MAEAARNFYDNYWEAVANGSVIAPEEELDNLALQSNLEPIPENQGSADEK